MSMYKIFNVYCHANKKLNHVLLVLSISEYVHGKSFLYQHSNRYILYIVWLPTLFVPKNINTLLQLLYIITDLCIHNLLIYILYLHNLYKNDKMFTMRQWYIKILLAHHDFKYCHMIKKVFLPSKHRTWHIILAQNGIKSIAYITEENSLNVHT